MSIVIIGSRGYLGSKLSKHYSNKGIKVIPLSYRPNQRLAFIGQLQNLLKTKYPEAIINAGALQDGSDSPDNLKELMDSNVLLPATLASIIRDTSPSPILINFGTSWQNDEQVNLPPSMHMLPQNQLPNHFLEHFALDGLKVASLRLYDTYGPDDPRNKIVNLIADALIHKHVLPMSPGKQVMDLVFIDDVLSAVDTTVALLKKETNGVHRIFSICSGIHVTVLDILDLLKKIAEIKQTEYITPGIYPYRPRERFCLSINSLTPPGVGPRLFHLMKG